MDKVLRSFILTSSLIISFFFGAGLADAFLSGGVAERELLDDTSGTDVEATLSDFTK
jgi:hypothetical protein